MNYSKLPSLKSLIAFECVVRCKSITKAARELNVTHSAISQNMKQLEERLGHILFTKSGRQIEATPSALLYAEEISKVLINISDVTKDFQLREEPNSLTLKMVSTLALRWFVPKMAALQKLQPELKIDLVTELISDIESLDNEVDVAIGFADNSQFEKLYHTKLCDSELVLLSLKPYSSPQQAIEENSAIYVKTPYRAKDWNDWCQKMGIKEPAVEKRILLSNSAQALEALCSGVGILVTQKIFVEQLLKQQHLVQIGQSLIDETHGYYFYCNKQQMARPSVRFFHDWLLETISQKQFSHSPSSNQFPY